MICCLTRPWSILFNMMFRRTFMDLMDDLLVAGHWSESMTAIR